MKKLIISALACMLGKAAFAQDSTLSDFNLQRQKTNQAGLLVLGSWAAANIAWGSIAYSHTNGREKYFNQMNVFWNIVNLGLVSAGYFTAKNEAELTYAQSLKKQGKTEKLFLLNAGLDVAYIAGGFYVKESAKNTVEHHDKYTGYGQSIVLQGGALLVFDAVMYAINHKHGQRLYKMADKVQLTATGNGVGVVVKL